MPFFSSSRSRSRRRSSLGRLSSGSSARDHQTKRRTHHIETLEPRLVLDSTAVFNEIMYNPPGEDAGAEWIELYNQLSVNIDLSNWTIEGGVNYTIPAGTVIAADSFVIIAADPEQLVSLGRGIAVLGPFVGRLDNGGEELRLVNHAGREMDVLDYRDSGRWPIAPDGSGASLAKSGRQSASGDAANWQSSITIGGTPGVHNAAEPGATRPKQYHKIPFDGNLRINEVAAGGAENFFVELLNTGSTDIELDTGVLATNEIEPREYAIPVQTLSPGQMLVIDATELGFTPDSGQKLSFYVGEGRTHVMDSVKVGDSLSGRLTDGDGPWFTPDVATPGETNNFGLHDEIVINEVMYNARPEYGTVDQEFQENREEWIELFNRSDTAVDLTGWTLDGGISFDFEQGTTIEAGEYLVVARRADVLAIKFPEITIVGNFNGTLSNGGDRIELIDSIGNPADELVYFDGGSWPRFADGGGASLELRDPYSDNNRAEAWADSDESSRTAWKNYSYTMTAERPVYNPSVNFQEFVMGIIDEGQMLIDNIEVVERPGSRAPRQLIQNSTFDADRGGDGTDKWRFLGTHDRSRVVADPDDPDNNVLLFIADAKANYIDNHAETTLAFGARVTDGLEYQISFDARWVAGDPRLRTELPYNDAVKLTMLDQPTETGTPGRQNSRYEENIGPTYENLQQGPSAIIPARKPATVAVAASDPNGIASMLLRWRTDGGQWQSQDMTADDDGRYEATIPTQDPGTLVQFYVEGTDTAGAMSQFPAEGADSRALMKWDDGRAERGLRKNFRILMLSSEAQRLHQDVYLLSNQRTGATVVFDEGETFYDVGVRLRGSECSRRNSGGVGFNIRFNPDQLFRGVHESVTMKNPGMTEILVKHLEVQAGLPGMYDDVIYLHRPLGNSRQVATLSMGRHTDVFIESQFENGGDGTVFKMEGIRGVQNAVGGVEGLKLYQCAGWVSSFDIADLGDDKEQYRWSIQIRSNRAKDDYSRIIDMAKAFSLTGEELQKAVDEVIDVEQWARTFALMSLAGIGDTYSQGNPHNLNFYVRPEDNKVIAMPWDWDFTFNRPVNSPLWGGKNIGKIFDLGANSRIFYRQLVDLMDTVYNTEYMSQWTENYGAVTGASFNGNLNYIQNRSDFVRSRLPAEIPLSIEVRRSQTERITGPTTTIVGNAWYNVTEIRIPGSDDALPLTWLTDTMWNAQVPVPSGESLAVVEAYDQNGNQVGTASIAVSSSYSGVPVGDVVRITELHYNPAAPTLAEIAAGFADSDDFEFIELLNTHDQAVSLAGIRGGSGLQFTDGIQLDFTQTDSQIEPGERVVVVSNEAAFRLRYGDDIRIIAQYEGQLRNSGEQIILVDGVNQTIHDFTYDDDELTWPTKADGNGSSLVVLDTEGDYSDPTNWYASVEIGGTPGADSSPPADEAPTVVSVAVSSSQWSDAILDQVNAVNPHGSGFALDDENASLPWDSIDTISVTFSEDVVVAADDLSLAGQVVADYLSDVGLAADGFSYDDTTFTASWQLAAPFATDAITLGLAAGIVDDSGNQLDGDWTAGQAFPSGDGNSGGAFGYSVGVLVGDGSQDGTVDIRDLQQLRAAILSDAGSPEYDLLVDFDGSGTVDIRDVQLFRTQIGTELPAPALAQEAPSADNQIAFASEAQAVDMDAFEQEDSDSWQADVDEILADSLDLLW